MYDYDHRRLIWCIKQSVIELLQKYKHFTTYDSMILWYFFKAKYSVKFIFYFSKSGVTNPKREKLNKKTLSKLAARLMKLYDIPQGSLDNHMASHL